MAEEVIVLTGIKETLDALKDFDKDAVRRFNKVINNELAGAERDAHNLINEKPPMSGWRKVDAARGKTRGGAGWPGWNAGEIKSKITKTKAQGSGGVTTGGLIWLLICCCTAASVAALSTPLAQIQPRTCCSVSWSYGVNAEPVGAGTPQVL